MRLTARQEREPRLVADQAGATMVMGVFMAVLLVGLIYYVWGIGDAVMFRERMQDASDTAAFSAAVVHARGMNLIALMNMIMAALSVVAATVAVISNMLGFATAAATFVCSLCWSFCDACAHAIEHGVEWGIAETIDAFTYEAVYGLNEGMHAYAMGLRVGVPLAAQARVQRYAEFYDPVTDNGVMLPIRPELPVEDDMDTWACNEKVAPYVAILAPINARLWSHNSVYQGVGIAFGMTTVISESQVWCQFGFFQRVTDAAQEQGNDEYQVQAYMLGEHDLAWTQTGVAVATWGEGDEVGGMYSDLAEFGDLSFAQAEFMFDDEEDDWREWMWAMNWRARLRRFRTSAAGPGGVGAALSGLSGALPGGGLDETVVH